MKILQAHNFYQYAGGEDTVVAQEKNMLEEKGHQIIPFYKYNEEIKNYSGLKKLKLFQQTGWSKPSFQEVDQLIQKEKIDLCQVHNFLPLISPSIYYACKKNKVPVVQTLHNYRLICCNGLFLRDGKVCEDCLGKTPYGAVLKKCYRNSSIQTFALAHMLQKNTNMNTWNKMVDAYFCLTDLAKEKFIAHGIDEERLIVKPNFLDIDLEPVKEKSPYLLFIGRLTESKGVLLIKELAEQTQIPIKIAGYGELENEFKNASNIEFLGKMSHTESLKLIQKANALLFPSIWYEGMPMTLLEAFALKTPVIASNLGAMKSMMKHKETGLLFEPNSVTDLKEKVDFALSNPNKLKEIAKNSYKNFINLYSKEANYKMMKEVFESLIHKTIS